MTRTVRVLFAFVLLASFISTASARPGDTTDELWFLSGYAPIKVAKWSTWDLRDDLSKAPDYVVGFTKGDVKVMIFATPSKVAFSDYVAQESSKEYHGMKRAEVMDHTTRRIRGVTVDKVVNQYVNKTTRESFVYYHDFLDFTDWQVHLLAIIPESEYSPQLQSELGKITASIFYWGNNDNVKLTNFGGLYADPAFGAGKAGNPRKFIKDMTPYINAKPPKSAVKDSTRF